MPLWLEDIKKTYFSPRILGIGFFAFPYGMMFFLAVSTPQVWLKDIGATNTDIGLFAIASFPYMLKFLWAPMVDLIKIPYLSKWLGHRRSWLLLIHVSLMIGLLLMGFSNPTPCSLRWTAIIALSLAFLAATQDIIVDAYRIEILSTKESVPGIGMLIFGYRLGSITAKAGTLYLAHYFSWPLAYSVMSLLIIVGITAVFFNPEPKKRPKPDRIIYHTVVRPFTEFVTRSPLWFIPVLFILLYRLADAMINNMANSFYIEIGFTKADIATVTNVFGVIASVVGGFLGAAIVRRLDVFKGVLFCGILHTISNGMFIVLSYVGNDISTLYGAIAVENITGGMSTAAFFVYLTRLCHMSHAVTQFALFTSIWSAQSFIASISGWIVDELKGDWPLFFFITIMIAIPGMILIPFLKKFPFGNRGELESVG
jgi:PAT family beta-lactamase induction signal transducer AmpG